MSNDNRYYLSKRVSIISLLINILLTILKVLIGFAYSSRALIADGIHSLSDMASTIVILISIKFSHSPADEEHPYGHGKAEAIGTSILAIILIITGILLIRDAVISIYSGKISIPGRPALWMALISIFVKEWLYRYTIKTGQEIKSKGLIADAHHHRSDALSSIAALIGVVGARLGYLFFDPLAGLVVALFIARIGFTILRDAINELMDGVPDNKKIGKFKEITRNVEGVIEVGDIKLRSYGPQIFIDLSVVVEDRLSVVEGHQVATDVKSRIMSADDSVAEVMVHIDPEKVYQNEGNR